MMCKVTCMAQRAHVLDYLRGLLALGILFYHICSWSLKVPPSETLLGKLGVYGVSLFYVISGASMSISYRHVKWSVNSLRSFFIKRYFRLAPLFILSTVLMLQINYDVEYAKGMLPVKLLANIALLFGLYDPGYTFVIGGWSIGNEFFFYLFFPLIIVMFTRSLITKILLFIAIIASMIMYGFYSMAEYTTLAKAWKIYISPLNNIVFFILGVSIPFIMDRVKIVNESRYALVMLFIFSAMFVFYPATGDQLVIVTGVNKLMLSLCCFLICASAYKIKSNNQGAVKRVLSYFGDISYSIYIMHGVVYVYLAKYIWPTFKASSGGDFFTFLIIVMVPCVILVSSLTYHFIEMPFIKFAARYVKAFKREC